MAEAGIRDILIANQVVGAAKIARLTDVLHARRLIVAVDSLDNAASLKPAASAGGARCGS